MFFGCEWLDGLVCVQQCIGVCDVEYVGCEVDVLVVDGYCDVEQLFVVVCEVEVEEVVEVYIVIGVGCCVCEQYVVVEQVVMVWFGWQCCIVV